jgi:hypothetical protein
MSYWTLRFDVDPAGVVTAVRTERTGGYGCRVSG